MLKGENVYIDSGDTWAGTTKVDKDGNVIQIPFKVPRLPPVFETFAEERKYRKERLALAFRIFGAQGYDEGVAGHITVRDPEHTEHFWVNPFGKPFIHMKVADLLLVDHQGKVVEGTGHINAAAFAIHSAIHKALPRVVAACHSHSMWGKSFSTLGIKLDAITQDSCAFYERHDIFTDFGGVVEEATEGQKIAAALGEKNHGVILQNHGLLTVGRSVDEALWWFVSMDRCCQSQMLAESTGRRPIHIPHEVAVKTRDIVGTPAAGWFNAQPLFDVAMEANIENGIFISKEPGAVLYG